MMRGARLSDFEFVQFEPVNSECRLSMYKLKKGQKDMA